MSNVIYPNELIEGQTIDAAKLDAQFAALTTVLNGNLGRENFRRSSGIAPAARANGYSLVPLAASAQKSSAVLPGTTVTFPGVIAMPHRMIPFTPSATAPSVGPADFPFIVVGSDADGLDWNGEHHSLLREPCVLLSMQGCVRKGANIGVGDTLVMRAKWTNPMGSTEQTQDLALNLTAPFNVVGSYTFATPQEFNRLEVDLIYTAAAGGLNRQLYNFDVITWIKVPHLL